MAVVDVVDELNPSPPPSAGSTRGGCRLPVGHPARGRTHSYRRCRELPPDPERRDTQNRERIRRAIGVAVAEGRLSRILARVLEVLLWVGNERAEPVYPSLAYIGDHAGGYSARTAGRWLAELRALGWIQAEHRFIYDSHEGRVRATTNLWRIDLPEDLRERTQNEQDKARAAKLRKTGRRSRSRPSGPPGPPPGTLAPLAGACSACEGAALVGGPNGQLIDCPVCDGSGISVRAGP